MSQQTNPLALEPLLVARLTAALADLAPLPHVLTAPDLAGVAEGAQHTPAVHVVYYDQRPSQVVAGGKIATLEQTWLTVAAVRNARQTRAGGPAREDVGVLLGAIWRALAGWRPEGFTPLQPAPGIRPAYTAGFIYHPLAWTSTLQLRGEGSE